ncbi:Ppx/GppA phosphatase family protein [Hyphomonas johnsonii]|jgi:exopolyphosphatase/guanosine-5'-triphosphate,3'-diphosphate pyrophosphatase|uniref:Ppx/GppA phosphatase family protein n=1 Tax=Hyphomonas johnsonii TaxID=81031 RepID=UPI000550CDDC|nr:Ppx/GppA phosphatase family protein [Hyphomonas johnsonii]
MADKKAPGVRPRRTPQRNGKTGPLFAAVDLGTNNCRLLVAEPRGKTFRVVDSHSQIARLGEGLHETGRLSDAAIDRAIDALQNIRKKIKQHGVGRVRCIATEACRKADNGAEFIRRVHAETGLTFKIIGSKEEARLATIGCHDLIEPDAASVLVVDIGGGSTELSWVNADMARANGFRGLLEQAPILSWTSLPLGVVTLSEAFSHFDEGEGYPHMLDHARKVLNAWTGIEQVREAMGATGAHMIGTSGTVTCLAGVHLKLDRYRRDRVDGSWLSREESAATIQLLRDLGLDGRATLPTIGEERAGLMLSGCAIVEAVWEAFPAGRLRVADRGLREGLLLSMMYGPKKSKTRRRGRRGRKPAAGSATGDHEGDHNDG